MNIGLLQHKQKKYAGFFSVAPGVWGMKDLFVNVYIVLNPFDGNWVLIDAGLRSSAKKIKKMAAQLFGESARPSSIILTHGHFDHVGSVKKLATEWDVPVFAHYLEIPYLTGRSSYPPPDPMAGGGLMSLLSWLYPSSPINISNLIHVLPENGRVPGLPEWKYIHTPGHAPGHISLFRDSDSMLIAGDAFVTTKAESVFSTAFQFKQLSGPPKYFTHDWVRAKQSVKKLAELEPETAATGHGKPIYGEALRFALEDLADHFYNEAVPKKGRYTYDSALANSYGVIYTPPKNDELKRATTKALAITAIAALTCFYLLSKNKKRNRNKEALAYEIW